MEGIFVLFFSELVGGHLVACIKRNFIKTLFYTGSKINLKYYHFYKNDLIEELMKGCNQVRNREKFHHVDHKLGVFN